MNKQNIRFFKFFLVFLVSYMLLLPNFASSQESGQSNVTILIVTNRAGGNIRAGNSIESEIICRVNEGTKLKMLEKAGKWYRIELESGEVGWIHETTVKADNMELVSEDLQSTKKIDYMLCPKCSKKYDIGVKFCYLDGARLIPKYKEEKVPHAGFVYCPKCGAKYDAGVQYCLKDGTYLKEHSQLAKNIGFAEAGEAFFHDMKGKFGAGIQIDTLNFGVGPSVEYWVTNNIMVLGRVGLVGDFKSYGIRGLYLFDKVLEIRGEPTKLYAGIGYASITGPEEDYGGSGYEVEGSGVELYGGLMHPMPYIYKNTYARFEVIYSAITLEYTIEYYGQSYTYEYDDYGDFSFGIGIVYYFR